MECGLLGAIGVPTGIFESPDALDVYLADVRERRDRRRREREQREMLESAVAKVQAEITAACDLEDTEITAELEAVLGEFTRRLQLLLGQSGAKNTSGAMPRVGADEAADSGVPTDLADAGRDDGHLAQAAVRQGEGPTLAICEPPRPSDAERAALAQPLIAEIGGLSSEWKQLDDAGLRQRDGDLARASCFRLRALACALGRLHAQATEQGFADLVQPTAFDLRDRMELARQYAGDGHQCLPFQDAAWVGSTERLSSDDWAILRERYLDTADAQEAYDWYLGHCGPLSSTQRVGLLNAIAAVQQRLFRELDLHEGQDKLQVSFYGDLRDAARDAGYLSALSPETSQSTLDAHARSLSETLAAVQRDYLQAEDRRRRQESRSAAILAVVEWQHGVSERCLSAVQVAAEAGCVHLLLDACQSAGVPPTNPEVRSALLDWGPTLLAGEPKYAKILDAVMAERKRKGIDEEPRVDVVDDEEEPSETAIELYKETIASFVAGQRLLILGGQPRPRICEELQEALGFSDVKWLPSKSSDKAGKFQAEIKKANILLLAKNFAGHDMSEKGREWIRSVNGHFVYLPSGYGVNQIIFQLYKYAAAKDGH